VHLTYISSQQISLNPDLFASDMLKLLILGKKSFRNFISFLLDDRELNSVELISKLSWPPQYKSAMFILKNKSSNISVNAKDYYVWDEEQKEFKVTC
jgi:hypothetical protein